MDKRLSDDDLRAYAGGPYGDFAVMARELLAARAELDKLRREVAELRPIARAWDERWHRDLDR